MRHTDIYFHIVSIAVIVLTTMTGQVYGATLTWTGGQGSNDAWGQGANWAGGSFTNGADVIFNSVGAGLLNPNSLNNGQSNNFRTVKSLTYNANSTSPVLTDSGGANNVLRIDPASAGDTALTVDAAAAAHTITAAIRLDKTQAWDIAAGAGDFTVHAIAQQGSETNGLTKLGGGTLVFTGAANTYTGLTTVDGGTLELSKSTAVKAIGGALTINNGGTVICNAGRQTASSSVITVNAGGTLTNTTNYQLFDGLVINGGTVNGSGNVQPMTVTLGDGASLDLQSYVRGPGNSVVYNGTTTTATISKTISLHSSDKTFHIANGTADVDLLVSGTIGQYKNGGGADYGITKTGLGTLVLSGNNTYTNATTVSEGTLNVRHSNALGTTAVGTTVQAGATLAVQGDISLGAEALTLSGGGGGGGGALRNVSGDNTWNAGEDTGVVLTLGSDTTIGVDADSLTLNVGLTKLKGGGKTLTKVGPGQLIINRAGTGGTYLGTIDAIDIQDGQQTGSAQINLARGSGTGAALTMADGTRLGHTVALNGTGLQTVAIHAGLAGVTMSGHVTFTGPNGGSSTKTFDVDDGAAAVDLLLSGGISEYSSGGGSTTTHLTKDGPGTMVMSANSSYSGVTTVNAGTLLIDGSIPGDVAVNGGVLGGNGSIGGTISGTGTVSPGTSPGTLTASRLDPSAGTSFLIELWPAGPSDVLVLTGANPFTQSLNNTNTVDIYLNVASLTPGETFEGGLQTLADVDLLAAVAGADGHIWVLGDGLGQSQVHPLTDQGYYALNDLGLDWYPILGTALINNGENRILELTTVIPEPATLALLSLAACGLGGYVRKRRKA